MEKAKKRSSEPEDRRFKLYFQMSKLIKKKCSSSREGVKKGYGTYWTSSREIMYAPLESQKEKGRQKE